MQKAPTGHSGSPHMPHLTIPGQFFLGLIFIASGGLFLLKKIGKNFLPFLPENILIIACAIGSLIGGIYLVIAKVWRPWLILR